MKLLSAVLLAALLGAAQARAESAAIDLPAGDLRGAVAALSRQAGVSVAVADPHLWRRRAPAVRGRMSAAEALRRLLKGSGARALSAGPGAWRIVAGSASPPAAPRPPQRASEVDTPPVEDVVVVASKRAVPLAGYPGNVTVIDTDRPGWTGRDGTEAILAQAATVSSTHLGSGRNKLFIRGIADSSFTGPTQATVGQYWGDVRLTYNAPDPDLRLHDVASIEVLEGPHGTLYGAGSMGGIVRIVRNRPQADMVEGWAEAGVSATRHGAPGADAAGGVNLPLGGDGTALRLVGYAASDGGYIDDPLRDLTDVNRTRIAGGRAALLVAPAEGWSVEVGVTGQDTDGRDSQYADRDAPRLTRRSRIGQGFDAGYLLGEVIIEGELGDLRLTSSTGLVRQRLVERYDASLPNGPDRLFRQHNRTDMVANETRIARPTEGGWGWVAGISLLHNRTRLDRALGDPARPMPATGVVNTVDEQTLYGEASLEVLPRLTLTAGGRVSHARLGGGGRNVLPTIARAGAEVTEKRDETAFLPSLAMSATPVDRLTLFARYQQGFRPGGLAIEADFVRRFRNDRVATLEAGVRYGARGQTPFDLSLSASRTRWRDIQADFVDGSGLPSTANIGDGRIHSFALAGGWVPVPGLRVEAGAAFNDSKVTEPVQALLAALPLGRLAQIPNIADVVARGSVEYETALGGGRTLALTASARYVGSSRLGVGPVLGAKQGDYLDTRLSARVGFGRIGVTLGVTNLTDELGNRFALGTPFQMGRAEQITPLRPRTIRLGIDAAF